MKADLTGHRVLVVGASSGIGRAVARAAAAAGATVAAAARRTEYLPDEAIKLRTDITDPANCAQVVADAREALGGLDTLVYAAGRSPLMRLADADEEVWRDVLTTNVIGAALVARAALPDLEAAHGRAVFMSSTAVVRPWPALGVYAASKAALDGLVQALRTEHAGVTFMRVVVGPTMTAFADGWDEVVLAEAMQRWTREGYMTGGIMTADHVAHEVVRALASPIRVEDITLVAQPPG